LRWSVDWRSDESAGRADLGLKQCGSPGNGAHQPDLVGAVCELEALSSSALGRPGCRPVGERSQANPPTKAVSASRTRRT